MNKEEIYLDLKRRILQEEELPPGEWLVERELSDHYQVSRTPIREVLRQLVADGFLESITKKGYMN